MTDQIWRLQIGHGPLVATAIHDGHAIRDELVGHLALGESDRLREEDPFTELWTHAARTRVVGLRSRFEVDLNRPRESAVYRTPVDAWGLQVWKGTLPDDVAARQNKRQTLSLNRRHGTITQRRQIPEQRRV